VKYTPVLATALTTPLLLSGHLEIYEAQRHTSSSLKGKSCRWEPPDGSEYRKVDWRSTSVPYMMQSKCSWLYYVTSAMRPVTRTDRTRRHSPPVISLPFPFLSLPFTFPTLLFPFPYNLYCVGADVKPCSINCSPSSTVIAITHYIWCPAVYSKPHQLTAHQQHPQLNCVYAQIDRRWPVQKNLGITIMISIQ